MEKQSISPNLSESDFRVFFHRSDFYSNYKDFILLLQANDMCINAIAQYAVLNYFL